MSHLKQSPPLTAGDFTKNEASRETNKISERNDTTPNPPLSSRRIDPKAGALLKLDFVEQRLKAARDSGDDTTWVRFYQSWLALHSLAFSYGKWGAGDV